MVDERFVLDASMRVLTFRRTEVRWNLADFEDKSLSMGVALRPGNESQSICFVKRDTVGFLNSRKLLPADDLHCCRIDRNDLIDSVNRHEDVA